MLRNGLTIPPSLFGKMPTTPYICAIHVFQVDVMLIIEKKNQNSERMLRELRQKFNRIIAKTARKKLHFVKKSEARRKEISKAKHRNAYILRHS